MDELIVAEVNAYMRDGVAHETEKYEIARVQFRHLDPIPDLADGIGAMRQHYPSNVTKNVTHETAAIETAFRAAAASMVGNPFMAERVLQQILDGAGQSLQLDLSLPDGIG